LGCGSSRAPVGGPSVGSGGLFYCPRIFKDVPASSTQAGVKGEAQRRIMARGRAAPPGRQSRSAAGFSSFHPPDLRCRTCPGWIWRGELHKGAGSRRAAGMAGRLFSFFLREEPRIYDDLRCVGIVVRGSGERLGCPTALFFFFLWEGRHVWLLPMRR